MRRQWHPKRHRNGEDNGRHSQLPQEISAFNRNRGQPTAIRMIFVNCTTELHEVISRRHLPAPSGSEIQFKSPDGEEVMHLCRNAEVVVVEHSRATTFP